MCPDCGQYVGKQPGEKVPMHQGGGTGTAMCTGAGKAAVARQPK